MGDYYNPAHERADDIPEHLIKDDSLEVTDADDDETPEFDYGIGYKVVTEAAPMIHEDTGEFRGYFTRVDHKGVLFYPETQPTKTPPWMTFEEAWEKIYNEYDWENPEQYVEGDIPVDSYVVLCPLDDMAISMARRA